MAHDGLQLVRCDLTSVRQINLMVAPLLRQVNLVASLAREGVHSLDRGRLVIIATDMQTLDTETLTYLEVLRDRAVDLLFLRCLPHRPVEDLSGDAKSGRRMAAIQLKLSLWA